MGIFKYDGTKWIDIGNSVGAAGGVVEEMCIYSGKLFAIGKFSSLGTNVATYDGSSWLPAQNGLAYNANGLGGKMVVYNSELYLASGALNGLNILPGKACNVIKWNGSTWSSLTTDLKWAADNMVVYNNTLYASGIQDLATPPQLNYFSKWNGSTWAISEFGFNDPNHDMQSIVHDMAVFNGSLYVAGIFIGTGYSPINFYIAKTP